MQPFHCLSDPRSHHRRCGLDPTAVSPAPPFSQVFAFDRSRERSDRAMAPITQRVPSKRRGSPLGLLSCGCLENGVAIHMGIMRSRYERSFLPIPPAGSLLLLLLIVVNRRTRASARRSFTNASNSSHG